MKKSTLTLAALMLSGSLQAQPAEVLWDTSHDDEVRCMAIGCAPGDHERYPEYLPAPEYDTPPAHEEEYEISHPVEHEILHPVEYDAHPILGDDRHEWNFDSAPISEVIPDTEDAAREGFYQAITEHAEGRATLRDVEAAYEHLLPYRD